MAAIVVAPLVVSQSQGDDATASRFGSPFKTLGAAKTAAMSGDTIVVMDGTFNERDLLRNGVHWSFMAGTKVLYTGAGSTNDRAIFDDSDGPVSCLIDGYGEFVWGGDNANLVTSGGNSGGVLWLQNSASVVSMRGYRASIYQFGNIGQDTFAIFIENCAQFYGSFEIIENELAPGGPFAWFDGNFNLFSKIIRAASSSYTVWAREPAAKTNKNGYIEADLIDNPSYAAVRLEGVSTNYKLWVRAKEIRGRTGGASIGAIQQSGGGKLYLETEKLDNTSSSTDRSPAINIAGGEAWIRAHKITTNLTSALAPRWTGQAVTCDGTTNKIALDTHRLNITDQVRFRGTTVPAGLTAGTWYWVVNPTTNDFKVSPTYNGSAINFTSNGSGVTIDSSPWAMFATVTGGKVFLDCQHLEQVNNYSADAFAIAGADSNTTFRLRGQIMSQVYNGRGIVHSGGSSRFAGLLIDTSITNTAGNRPVQISAAGLVLEQCKLIAPALAESIYAATPQTLTCYGVKANRANNPNVTPNVDFAVDPNTV